MALSGIYPHAVAVGVGVSVGVIDGVQVGVCVGVIEGVVDGVRVGVSVGVTEGGIGVSEGIGVRVSVGAGVKVGVANEKLHPVKIIAQTVLIMMDFGKRIIYFLRLDNFYSKLD